MRGSEFKRIRNKLNMTQDELALVLGFSGKVAVSNIETEFRQPSLLVVMMIMLLDEMPATEKQQLVKRLKDIRSFAEKQKNKSCYVKRS